MTAASVRLANAARPSGQTRGGDWSAGGGGEFEHRNRGGSISRIIGNNSSAGCSDAQRFRSRNHRPVPSGTKATSDEFLETRVYDVGDLLDLDYGEDVHFPVGAGGMGGGGGGFMSVPQSSAAQGKGKKKAQAASKTTDDQSVTVSKRNLADIVMEMTSPPCTWLEIDGQGGAIRIVGRTLVVRQTPLGHREIVRLLNQLSESAGKAE